MKKAVYAFNKAQWNRKCARQNRTTEVFFSAQLFLTDPHPYFKVDLMVNKNVYEKIVQKKPFLFWSVGDKTKLGERAVIEAVLKYGDFDDFLVLKQELGLNTIAQTFNQLLKSSRGNMHPRTINFWKLYFERHVPQSH
ncbi:MAG: hypothetical protein R6U55_09745 [Desulfovermiculus sp.]